jgi:phosphatidylglycerophosphate synthase
VAEPLAGGSSLSPQQTQDHRLSWDEYSARWASLHGGVDPRRSSAFFLTTWLRLSYTVGRGLAGLGVGPSAVTVVGLLCSVAVPLVVLPRGSWLFAGGALVLLSALADSADGAVAIVTGRTTRIGSFYDALADRVSEASWLLALWLLGAPGILVVACGGLAWLHEYARARGALSGLPGVGAVTVAERPTRVIAAILALALGGAAWLVNPHLTPGVITIVVSVWTLLGVLGAARLLNVIRSQLR